MSAAAPAYILSNDLCFLQIGQIVPELGLLSGLTDDNNSLSVISSRCSILCAKVRKIRRNNADILENRHFFDNY